MADDAEREPGAPDISGGPSLRDALAAFTPPGTDPDALMDALKSSRMPSVPLSQIGKATQASAGMRWCHRCGRPEPATSLCPAALSGSGGITLGPIGAQAGTTCASCQARGITTLHSPAGDEHAEWQARWARDPLWMPDDATRFRPVLHWCDSCQCAQPDGHICAGQVRPDPPHLSLPADPFPEDMLAGLGIAQMLEAMEAGGVPPLRAERIVGAMLAAHGMMMKEAEGDEGGA